jgi:hypothetical protein
VAGGASGSTGAGSFKSFRLEEVKKLLAKPAVSKRMKAIQQLFDLLNNDSDSDEGALNLSSCGLNAYGV